MYKELTPKRKEGLLSQIAFKTFDNKEYFFKQRTIESYIGEYICNLPTAPKEQTKLDIDSQAVLKSIEAQHGLLVERARGIYSFSHLTFQEYFTARKIANISNPNELETALIYLANHVTKKRWREVFLLTATLLEPADRLLLLMKQNIDELLANETRLQEYLVWVRDKSNSVESDYKIAGIRQFYISLDLNQNLSPKVDPCLNLDLYHYLNLDLSLDLSLNRSLFRSSSLFSSIKRCAEGEFKQILKKLQKKLEKYDQLSNKKSVSSIKELREVMIKYRNIGHEWNFNSDQINLLNQYLTTHQLLVDCLNSECYVSREVRQEVEDTLFLPFADLNYD